MKILFLVEACAAGVGRHAVDLARNLSREHDVHLVYSPGRADRAFLKGIESLRTHALPMRRNPDPSDIGAGLRLRRYTHLHGPFDVIHAHSTKAGLLMRTALAGLPGTRIYTPHAPLTMDPTLNTVSRGVLEAYEKLLTLWTDRIICVSQEELDHLQGLGIPRRKLSLVVNGIEALEAPQISKTGPVCIGFLGRLATQKNLPMLLSAFAQLSPNTRKSAVLAIAGTGPGEPTLRAEADRLGIASQIRWLGECDASILQSFDIFALPSLYEGLAYVLLESMAAGLPVVATRVGGVSLLVDDGLHGFTVPIGDAPAFAHALQRLLEDPELRARMGAASRERVSTFTVARMVSGVLDVYLSSTAKHAPLAGVPLINIMKASRGRVG